jgi:hypothetical protein
MEGAMIKPFATAAATVLLITAVSSSADAHGNGSGRRYSPGAPGIGDPYFPLAGNGGYDVSHYDLDVTYDPATDVLDGRATIKARATQNLSSFNLDLDGLEVRRVEVDGRSAAFSRDGGELTITPKRGLARNHWFTAVITYDGVPQPIDEILGVSGFIHTDDGTLVAGQPKVASTWYPVNDHPLDTASYNFEITVPAGLEAIANGVLVRNKTRNGWTTWEWDAREPMASYLTTMTVGEFDVRAYKAGGLKYWDAVDPNLYDPVAVPHTGLQMALSLQASSSYKRLTRTISVPADDTTLTFWVDRDTEFGYDFFFVEARTPGGDDWTTLPEATGITFPDTVFSCPDWLFTDHPFVTHYQTDNGDGTCAPSGSSGDWNAVAGASDGYELWTIDLSAYAGSDVEISMTYASDREVQAGGVLIDDIDAPGVDADTGFEDDGNALDGWTVPGAPEGSAGNENDWIVGTEADGPPPLGAVVDNSFARQPEIISFLSGVFGRYPFRAAGGIVDDYVGLGFALENQTRPIYSRDFFGDPIGADSVVVHELTHQWFGDDLPLGRWQDIWLNEGFATYAEWLWSEHEGFGTPQEIFDFYTTVIPPDDPFWTLPIGDPGPDLLFEPPVYLRGGMTLHALRLTVGDDVFFKILQRWASMKSGENVTTPEFIRLAERMSHQDLDALFDAWLYTPSKPELPAMAQTTTAREAAQATTAPAIARAQMQRLGIPVR